MKKNYVNKKVVVRCDRAGVFFGTYISHNEKEIILKDVRKLFYWEGANAVEQIALDGVKNPDDCKFTVVIYEMVIANPIQIIPASDKAIINIESVKLWKK